MGGDESGHFAVTVDKPFDFIYSSQIRLKTPDPFCFPPHLPVHPSVYLMGYHVIVPGQFLESSI